MSDLVFLLVTAGFFASAVALVHACDRLVGRGDSGPTHEAAPDLLAATPSPAGQGA